MKNIAIIGAGNMGAAIARGLEGKGYNVTVSNPHSGKLEKLKSECPSVSVTTDNAGAARGADLVVLAVKPYMVAEVVAGILPAIDKGRTVVASLAAPVSLDDLEEMLGGAGSKTPVAKVIPNTALSVGESMTFICARNLDDDSLEALKQVFATSGSVDVIPERLMGAATALCSCGIAYAMRYIRAAVEGAVELGIRPADALAYEVATLRGACALLEGGAHPEAEIDKVTTPGGITIRGLNAMESHGFTTAVIEGLKASMLS